MVDYSELRYKDNYLRLRISSKTEKILIKVYFLYSFFPSTVKKNFLSKKEANIQEHVYLNFNLISFLFQFISGATAKNSPYPFHS